MKKNHILLSTLVLIAGAFAKGQTFETAEVVTSGVTYSSPGRSLGGGAVGFAQAATNADWYSFAPACDGDITVAFDNGDLHGYLYDAGSSATCLTSETQIDNSWWPNHFTSVSGYDHG